MATAGANDGGWVSDGLERRSLWRWAAFGLAVAAFIALAASTTPAGAQRPGTVQGQVVDGVDPVEGVVVDAFTAGPGGARLEWLGSSRTGDAAQVRYRFDLPVGDYVLTFIAPERRVFEATGTGWVNLAVPVATPGEDVVTNAVHLANEEDRGLVSGRVIRRGRAIGPEPAVTVDLFEARADGGRGRWLESTIAEDGRYDFTVGSGCWVVTFIAPEGMAFAGGGSPWANRSFCRQPGDDEVTGLDVELLGPNLRAHLHTDPGPLVGAQVDLFTSDESERRLEWVESILTDERGEAWFEVENGCWVVTMLAPEGSLFASDRQPWRNVGVCVTQPTSVTTTPARVVPESGTIEIAVRPEIYHDRIPINGLQVGVFHAKPDGSPGTFLGAFPSANFEEASGTLPWMLPNSCLVFGFVAPEGETFLANGQPWLNEVVCVGDREREVAQVAVDLTPRPAPEIDVDLTGGPVELTVDVDAALSAANPSYRLVTDPARPWITYQVLGREGGGDCSSDDVAGLYLARFRDDTFLNFLGPSYCRSVELRPTPGSVFSLRPYVGSAEHLGRYRVRLEAVAAVFP